MDTAWLITVHFIGDESTSHRLSSTLTAVAFLTEAMEWHDVVSIDMHREDDEERKH